MIDNKQTTLIGELYLICSDKIDGLKVNEYGLPLPEGQFDLYMLKVIDARNHLNGVPCPILDLEAELTNDTTDNLATIVLYKYKIYKEQLGYIEVIRRVISEKITKGEVVKAESLMGIFKDDNRMLTEEIVRELFI